MEKKTLGILLLTGPYTHQNSETFVKLARSALENGYAVKAFLFVDGVNNAKLNQNPDPLRPMNEQFQELAEMDLVFRACSPCTSARGFGQEGEEFISGVEIGGLNEFAEIVGECDRFITMTL